jgi:hypothetical protein
MDPISDRDFACASPARAVRAPTVLHFDLHFDWASWLTLAARLRSESLSDESNRHHRMARADDLAAISSLILRTFHEGDGSARIIERAALAQGICGHPKETGGYHAHVFNCGGHLYRVTRAASPYAACVLAGPHQDAGRTAIHRVHDD